MIGCQKPVQETGQTPSALPAGSPPVFGAAPPVGPEITPATVAEAEKLLQEFLDANEARMQPRMMGSLLANLGLLHFYQGRMAEAEQCFERSLEHFAGAN